MTDYDTQDPEALRSMAQAGREVVQWQGVLAKTGDNVVGEEAAHPRAYRCLR